MVESGRRSADVSQPRVLLHLEGAALCAGAVAIYFHLDFSAITFLALVLAPDLSLIAYAAGPRAGAITYNAVHTTVPPVILGAAGVIADEGTLIQIALIWLAHIGIDRAVGYGLKYPTAFKDNHLGRV